MKRFAKTVCLILALLLCLAVPAAAQETVPYASSHFMSFSCYFANETSTSFQVWFDVSAKRGMTELGVDYITVERSSDGVNWTPVKTYSRSSYSNLVAYNTSNHCSYVTYSNVQSGYQYRAYVEFYAKDSSGTAYQGFIAD